MMKTYIYHRVLEVAKHINETQCTIREAAKVFGVSKSTNYKDMTERLKKIDRGLYSKVRIIFEHHKNVRHIRGGVSNRKKLQDEDRGDIEQGYKQLKLF